MAISYPFTPELLDALPERLAGLFRELDNTLLTEICTRLNLSGRLNEVTVQGIRALRAQGIDLSEIEEAIRKTTGTGERELERLLDDVVARNRQYYREVADFARITAPEVVVGAAAVDAIRRQTLDTYRNITQSMGFLVDNGRTMLLPADTYQWALDSAALRIQTGAISYNQAIFGAVTQLADSGIRVVSYESGHKDHVDVAVRRAVMTGINQLNQAYREQAMEDLETDLVEITAHLGARNIDGPNGWENHAAWQGKVYRWAEKSTDPFAQSEYADFADTCGYGSVTGIGGANCRHSFWPFIDGIMERTYTDEELEAMKPENRPKIEFEGVEYDDYQATQKQREIERTYRRLTRRETAYSAAGQTEAAQSAIIRRKRLMEKYEAFSRAAGLRTQYERMRVTYR